MLLSFLKTAFNAASIFSARYRPLAKYDFASLYIRDIKGICKTFQGLKVTFANFLNTSLALLIDNPLINSIITIKPPRIVSI
jgi:hypothetical protein